MKSLENGSWQVAELELVYRTTVKPSQMMRVTCSNEVYRILNAQWNQDKLAHIEQVKMLALNKANRVLGIFELGTGGIDMTVVDPRLVFSTALLLQASSIIMAHNHPSGNLTPSEHDIRLTRKLCSGGKLLDIQVLDHLILTTEGYYSFADNGLIE